MTMTPYTPKPIEKPKPRMRLAQCNKANRLYRRYVNATARRTP